MVYAYIKRQGLSINYCLGNYSIDEDDDDDNDVVESR